MRATVHPTEDGSRVITAARNLLGSCPCAVEEREGEVVIRSSDVKCLLLIHDQLRDRHVRDAARRLMLVRRVGDDLNLLFNRQAAFRGVVALCASETESPLGPIVMDIRCERSDELIDWLTAH